MTKIIKLLFKLGISHKSSLIRYHKGVRDRSDVNVLKCKKSGVLVLDKIIVLQSKINDFIKLQLFSTLALR